VPVPINLSFELAEPGQFGLADGWAITQLSSSYSWADFGAPAVEFDATILTPDAGGEFALPHWLEIICATAERSIQTSEATVQSGFVANAARARRLAVAGDWGLAVEKSTTNIISEQDLATWSTYELTASSATAPDGSTGNHEHADDQAGDAEEASRTFASDAAIYELSTWSINLSGGGASNASWILNAGIGGTASIAYAASETEWGYRSDSTNTALGGTSPTMRIKARVTAGDTGSIRSWGLQAELGSYPTSFIGADNATFSRATETLRAKTSVVVEGDGFFDWVFTWRPHYADSEVTGVHYLLWLDADNNLRWDGSTGDIILKLDGVVLFTIAATWSRDQELTAVIHHSAASSQLTLSGFTTGDGLTSGAAQAAIDIATIDWVYIFGDNTGASDSADLIRLSSQARQSLTETFEAGWGTTHRTAFDDLDLEFAGYSDPPLLAAELFESFEALSGWDLTYLSVLASTNLATYGSHWDAAAEQDNFEDFELAWHEVEVDVAGMTGTTVTSNSHGFGDGDRVRFTTVGGGALAGSISEADGFFVRDVTANTYAIEDTVGGGALSLTIGFSQPVQALRSHGDFDTVLPSSAAASFDRASSTTETFAGWADVDADVEGFTTTNVDITGHPFFEGDAVEVLTSGTLPTPLAASTVYFVGIIGADDITLSATKGGGAISLSGGSGTHTVRRMQRESFDQHSGTDLETAQYRNGTDAFEDFETVRGPVAFSVTPGTDLVLATGHPFSNGEKVTVSSTGALPLGLSQGLIVYFVINANANDLQLSLTSGGAAVDIQDNGSGTHTLISDPDAYWTNVVTF